MGRNKISKTQKNKSKKYRRKHRITRRKKGGKMRIDEIKLSLGRQHTNPDIKGVIRVESGPTFNKSDSRGEYISNFFADVAKSFEEDIALMIKGEPKSRAKKKVFTIEYNDNDAPLEKGSTDPIKCKKPQKKEKK